MNRRNLTRIEIKLDDIKELTAANKVNQKGTEDAKILEQKL